VAVLTGTRIRHRVAPNPEGCRWCGVDHGHHGYRWVNSHGMHHWEPPTGKQRAARMRARQTRKATR
jgi:hypothetical protein